jgi:hypothetical protein
MSACERRGDNGPLATGAKTADFTKAAASAAFPAAKKGRQFKALIGSRRRRRNSGKIRPNRGFSR